MADTPLTEALAHYESHMRRYPDWRLMPETAAVLAAARKWAELEALVADGGRVAVETPCQHGRFEFHGPISDANHGPCLGNERRIILGEGAEQ